MVDHCGFAEREDVRRPVGEVDSGAGDGEHHLVLREVRDRMIHRLVGRGHAHRRRIVIRSVVQGGHSPGPGLQRRRQRHGAVSGEDDLRGLDLDLERDRPLAEAVLGFQRPRGEHHRPHLVDGADLRQREHEVLRQPAASLDELGQEQVESAQTAFPGRLLHAFEPDAHEAGGSLLGAAGHRIAGGLDDPPVLGLIALVAESVFEVQTQVLDRFAFELGGDRLGEEFGLSGHLMNARHLAGDCGTGFLPGGGDDAFGQLQHSAMGLDAFERLLSPLMRQVCTRTVAGDVDGVHGLADIAVSGVRGRQKLVRVSQQ